LVERIEEIVAELRPARYAYYNDDPIMSDAEYDLLEDELREGMDALRKIVEKKTFLDLVKDVVVFLKGVGAKAAKKTKWKTVKHSAPMGSLMKVKTSDEFIKWYAALTQKIAKAKSDGDIDKASSEQVGSEKLDGISLSLKYVKGKFVQGVTRGDGEEGEDISRNVRLMKGFQDNVRDLTGMVRAEIILKKSDHKKYLSEYKNPRNAASGIAKRESDPEPCKHLTIICYQIISEEHDITSKSMEFKMLKALGFLTPNWKICKTQDAVLKMYQDYIDGKREKLDYEIDGLVYECNILAIMEHLGEHDGRPKGARAFKFPHEEQPTRLRKIVWQVGKSGRVTPVAYFETVDLVGASVSQATLHNISNIHRLAAKSPQTLMGLGDTILVSRRGDVIPQVEKVIKASKNARYLVPTECPSCDTKLKMKGEYLMCGNGARCPAQQSGSIKRWVEKLDIKDWGGTLIEALCENGMVVTIADLYGLDEDALAAVTLSGKRVGKSTAKKVMKNLRAKMELPIGDFVGSLGIDLWGRSMVKLLAAAGIDTIEKMEDAAVGDIARIPRVGETKAVAFVNGFGRRKKLIDDLLAAGVTVKAPIVGGKLSGVSFCFTGVRDKPLMVDLENAGATVKGSVGSGLTYLVVKSKTSSSAKMKKAKAQGTSIVTLDEAKALLR